MSKPVVIEKTPEYQDFISRIRAQIDRCVVTRQARDVGSGYQ